MAIKLQQREQSIIGVGAILAVLFLGWFSFIEPQLKTFKKVSAELGTAKMTEQGNESSIESLKVQKTQFANTSVEMPTDKTIGSIDFQAGETLESKKRDMLDTVIDMAQSDYGNKLVLAKPLPKPPPPPEPINTDGSTTPQLRLSDFIDEIPYEIALRGSYKSINSFINDLTNYDTVVEVSNVEVIPEKDRNLTDPTRPLKVVLKINYIIKRRDF